MKKLTVLLLLFTFSCSCYAQKNSTCIVYQYKGKNDKPAIALEQHFNSAGKIISEKYNAYQRNSTEGNESGTYYYTYKDTVLIKRVFVKYNGDSSRVLYFYNDHKQLIREEYAGCERRIKKGVDKGLGRPGGCVVFDSDLDSNRTWAKTGEIKYFYDGAGRKTRKEDDMDYTKEWEYDQQGRLIREKGLEHWGGKLAYTLEYEYFKGGYKYTGIGYDSEGKPQKPEYGPHLFSPTYINSFYTDKDGRVVTEEITTERNLRIGKEITRYNADGQIIEQSYYDGKGNPEYRHIYSYSK